MLLDKSLEKNFCTVPQFWDNAVQDGTLAKLNSLDKGEVCDLLGISVCGDYETWNTILQLQHLKQQNLNLRS